MVNNPNTKCHHNLINRFPDVWKSVTYVHLYNRLHAMLLGISSPSGDHKNEHMDSLCALPYLEVKLIIGNLLRTAGN